MKLFFRKTGTGQPLVIIHGLLGSSDNWLTLSKTFAENFTVHLIDLRNHGRSLHSDEFTVGSMIEDLLEFMEDQELDSAHILGHSLGGWVAMNFAVNYPNKVDKLIIEDFAPRKYHNDLIGFLKWLLDWDVSNLKSLKEADWQLEEISKNPAVRGFILKNLKRKKNGGFEWKPNLRAIHNNLDQVSGYLDGTHRFEKPTIFIRGGKSDYIRQQDEALIKNHFPKSQTTTIHGAGHWVHADEPEGFVAVVKKFLRPDTIEQKHN
jgi:esterase